MVKPRELAGRQDVTFHRLQQLLLIYRGWGTQHGVQSI